MIQLPYKSLTSFGLLSQVKSVLSLHMYKVVLFSPENFLSTGNVYEV